MKKLFGIVLAAALTLPLFAQENQPQDNQSKGRPTPEDRAKADYSSWLPAEGDWSVGFNLDPITTFVGNIFNGTVNQALDKLAGEGLGSRTSVGNNTLGLPQISVMGSYMATDNLELKLNIGLITHLRTNRQYVLDDQALVLNPLSNAKVIDQQRTQDLGATFAFGANYRVGSRRVQGIFGGGLIYGYQAIDNATYTYGNAMTEANQHPTTSSFYGTDYVAAPAGFGYMQNVRRLKEYADKGTHMVGLYGQIGVEFFVAPKVALGANVNVLFDYNFKPNTVNLYEGWNPLTMSREEFIVLDTPMQSGFDFDTDNIGANIYMSFYF